MAVVHLEEKYPLSSLAEITDLLLLSWEGLTLYRYVMDRQLAGEVECTELELEEAGVYDQDSREANLAWHEEQKRVMQIDLGEAELNDPTPAPPLTRASKNKGRRAEDATYAPRKRQATKPAWLPAHQCLDEGQMKR